MRPRIPLRSSPCKLLCRHPHPPRDAAGHPRLRQGLLRRLLDHQRCPQLLLATSPPPKLPWAPITGMLHRARLLLRRRRIEWENPGLQLPRRACHHSRHRPHHRRPAHSKPSSACFLYAGCDGPLPVNTNAAGVRLVEAAFHAIDVPLRFPWLRHAANPSPSCRAAPSPAAVSPGCTVRSATPASLAAVQCSFVSRPWIRSAAAIWPHCMQQGSTLVVEREGRITTYSSVSCLLRTFHCGIERRS